MAGTAAAQPLVPSGLARQDCRRASSETCAYITKPQRATRTGRVGAGTPPCGIVALFVFRDNSALREDLFFGGAGLRFWLSLDSYTGLIDSRAYREIPAPG